MAQDPEAQYNQTVADVGLQETWENGQFAGEEGDVRANAGYQESEVSRVEPGAFKSESNAANRGGILTSGINSARKDSLTAGFAARRTGIQLARDEGINRINRAREQGGLKRNELLQNAATRRAEEKDREAAANPPVNYGTPTVPAGATPPPGDEFNNGLTVPIGTKVIRPYAEKRVRK